MKPRSAPDWMQRLSPAPVSDEETREAATNLTEFFTILLEWDAAQSPSAASIDEDPDTNDNRGRSLKP